MGKSTRKILEIQICRILQAMPEDLRSHSRLWIRKSTNLSCTDSNQLSHDNKCHQWSEEGLWYQWNSLSNINTWVRNVEMMTWFKKKCVCWDCWKNRKRRSKQPSERKKKDLQQILCLFPLAGCVLPQLHVAHSFPSSGEYPQAR